MRLGLTAKAWLAVLVLPASMALAQVESDDRIDPAKIKDAIDFARTDAGFATTTAANLDENAPPRGVGGSDPVAVKEIVAMEMALQDVYNREFLTHPAAPLRYYTNSPDRSYFDLLVPGEYYGDDVRKYYEYIGPAFIGRLEFKEIKVVAKGEVGFVYMKQNYYGKDLQGQPIHWIMRQTDGVMKESGKWKIMHTHISFPITDFKTREANLLSPKRPLPWEKKSK
jgi:ketosteroid isomerase-like protein